MSILQQLYKESTETKETVENINETLDSLYSLRKKEAKEEDKERKTLEQIRKRQLRDEKRRMFDAQQFKEIQKEEKKKEKKGWLQSMLEGLGKLIGPVLAAIQGLPALISGALGGLGIGAAILKGLALLGPILIGAIKGALIAGLVAAVAKTLNTGVQSLYQQVGGIGETENGVGFTIQDISDMRGEAQRYADEIKAPTNSSARERLNTFYDLEEAMRSKKAANDRLFTNRPKLKEMEEEYAILKAKGNDLNKYEKRKRAQMSQDIERLRKQIEKDEKQKKDQDKLMKKLYKQLMISEKDLVQSQIDKGRRSIDDIPDSLSDEQFKDRDWTGHAYHSWQFTDYGDSSKTENKQTGGLVHLQTGGVFTVPGHGNGDQVPMALPSGSFVLNRNASAMLQNGGVAPQVNTLLEPGEKVFMPGTWEKNGIQQLNQDVPRKGPGSMQQLNQDVPRKGPGSMQQPERRQSGGSVGKAVAHIKKDEALSSLQAGPFPAGESDYIKPGGFSVKSNTPWGDIHGGTKLYAYKDGKQVPTIGWGNTYYDNIRNGQQPVKMGDTITKDKADQIMNVNVNALARDYASEIPHWGKMSESQQAGLISMGYNAPNFYTSNTFAPKLKAALTAGDMSKAADNLSWGGPSPTRISESQAMLRQGPMDVSKGHTVTGKTNATMPSNPPGQFQKKQSGGMVNTLLEPGEKVFLPGTWEKNGIADLNSSIPRHGAAPLRRQSGGPVEASHPDTGSGWSVGKDQYGRPAVFSKPAAKAFMEAMKASNGIVKPSDITSSTRSPAKNTAVGGVPNSNHLYGNAVDIHGASKSWLKENGLNHGWKNLVYSGHDGHFDFKGGGQLTPAPGDGREQTATGNTSPATSDPSKPSSGKSDSLGLNDMFGNAKAYFSTLLGGIGDGLGLDFIGDIAGMLGGQHRVDGKKGERWSLAPETVKPKPSETTERMAALQEDSNTAEALGVKPIVISSNNGGSQQQTGTVTMDGSAHTDVPNLPDGPSSSAQADYFYRLPLGGVL